MIEPWSAEAILTDLGTACIGGELHLFERVDSTNDLAVQHGLRGGREGAVFVAEAQERGRGRRGRAWYSPPGCGIYCSVLLAPGGEPERLGLLSLMTGVALAEALASCGDFPVRLKWPNDLILGGRKLGGILCELQQVSEGGWFVVVGFGINVTLPECGGAANLSPEVRRRATALCAEGRREVSRVAVLRACLRRLDAWYRRYRGGDLAGIVPAWKRRAILLGEEVEVYSGAQVLRGIAREIDAGGALLLEMADGALQRIVAGDVETSPAREAAAAACRPTPRPGGGGLSADQAGR
ncbi:MAG: biotin--[acetyl-CoA-carboxylase] ligase [Candidatus Tectomicrobia bacterium]|nr:biotin--[acetyl-CoA-carboxylase] ligase [Candidatus Tectomicrobia bacterium]